MIYRQDLNQEFYMTSLVPFLFVLIRTELGKVCQGGGEGC